MPESGSPHLQLKASWAELTPPELMLLSWWEEAHFGGRSRGPLVDPGDEARAWGKLSKRQPGEPWGMAECWARGGLEEELGAANGLRGGG